MVAVVRGVIQKSLLTFRYVYYLQSLFSCAKSAPALFFFFFNASPFVPYLCVYYHAVYWFMNSTEGLHKQDVFKEKHSNRLILRKTDEGTT